MDQEATAIRLAATNQEALERFSAVTTAHRLVHQLYIAFVAMADDDTRIRTTILATAVEVTVQVEAVVTPLKLLLHHTSHLHSSHPANSVLQAANITTRTSPLTSPALLATQITILSSTAMALRAHPSTRTTPHPSQNTPNPNNHRTRVPRQVRTAYLHSKATTPTTHPSPPLQSLAPNTVPRILPPSATASNITILITNPKHPILVRNIPPIQTAIATAATASNHHHP